MAPKKEKRPPLADDIGTKYTMLDPRFNKRHRARFIENGVMLPPLRMRAHKTTVKMEYDDRYTSFFRRARLLGFVLQFKRKPPTLVHSALTALIDRWRPETHNFHLPCGEMTVTLEDWAMITSNQTSGIPLSWLLEHRSKCPEDAEPRVVEQYARAYLWYILTEVVFPDCSGNSALWMYLDFLKDRDAGYSWGAAGLAYLYHSLDDATQRAEVTSGMCGCVWGLSIWMWERIPVGRPEKMRSRAWTDYGGDDKDDRYPTVAYAWDVVRVYTGESKALYKVFSNELDALTPFQVTWRLYSDDREWGFELNSMCKQDQLLFRCIVPMICVYAVEYHLPQRVAAQFGKAQHPPPAGHNTGGYDLHQMSRQKNQSITDWEDEHARYVKEWNE
nr:protein MAIN-LIKE 1-like [Aegilops tauschii subsp. strangulata]